MRYIGEINKYFQNRGLYTVSNYVLNGEALMNLGSLDLYDIVFVKNALTQVTGLYALQNLLMKTKNKPETIILMTPFLNDFIVEKCEEMDIKYIYNLDMNIEEIHDIICRLEIENIVKGKKAYDQHIEIINFLKQIGLLKTYIGYSYFEYVLNTLMGSSENLNKYMTSIYQMVADRFEVSPSSVEKAMRLCLKSSLSKSDNFYAKMLFGHQGDNIPSTSMFLQVCVKTLKEQKNYIMNQFDKALRNA